MMGDNELRMQHKPYALTGATMQIKNLYKYTNIWILDQKTIKICTHKEKGLNIIDNSNDHFWQLRLEVALQLLLFQTTEG